MRPRTRDKHLPLRVYVHHGSYWFRPLRHKPIRLCPTSDGVPEMLRAFATALAALDAPSDSMTTLVSEWKSEYLANASLSDETRATYGRLADEVGRSFGNFTPSMVDTPSATKFLAFWKAKPRMQNEARKVARQIFDWAVREGRVETNPFDKTQKAKIKDRDVYIPDEALSAILDAMVRGSGNTATHNGVMTRAFVELAYVTGQRAQDIRMLRWSDVGESSMAFQPSKTSESSGLKVKFARTPEIERILRDVKLFVEQRNARLIADAAEQESRRSKGLSARSVPAPVNSPFVLHRLDGKPFQQTGVRTAWRRAIELTQYKDSGYTIKDIRPKALTDADATMELKDVQKMAAHTSITTTEGYVRKRRVPTITSPNVVPTKSSATEN